MLCETLRSDDRRGSKECGQNKACSLDTEMARNMIVECILIMYVAGEMRHVQRDFNYPTF